MLKVIIPVAECRLVNARKGDRQFLVQSAGLIGSDGLASRFDIWHAADQTPYKPGEYVLDADRSVFVDREGNLAVRPVLAHPPKAEPAGKG